VCCIHSHAVGVGRAHQRAAGLAGGAQRQGAVRGLGGGGHPHERRRGLQDAQLWHERAGAQQLLTLNPAQACGG